MASTSNPFGDLCFTGLKDVDIFGSGLIARVVTQRVPQLEMKPPSRLSTVRHLKP